MIGKAALPIGMFDSGLGGFTVLRELKKIIPNQRVIYYGDTLNVPYGGRPPEEIHGYALRIMDFLVGEGVKAIAIACNASSSLITAAEAARYPVPVFSLVYNGAEAALEATKSGRIGVLATEATVKVGAYPATMRRLNQSAQAFQVACPAFVPLVEAGKLSTDEAVVEVRKCLSELERHGVDTIVHGCTHFPFLEPIMRRFVANGTAFVDPAGALAHEIATHLLKSEDVSSDPQVEPDVIYVSKLTPQFAEVGSKFLGRDISNLIEVHVVNQPSTASEEAI